jgi:exodeoxyribonuclease VII large subunit
VRGEITGFKAWRSGHWYFSLRDQIRPAALRDVRQAELPAPAPTDGTQVFVFARPSMYEEKGEFQLTVMELLSTDQGGLWKLAFEKAKAALTKDGLLDPARKRRLPQFPNRIAVVTSPTARCCATSRPSSRAAGRSPSSLWCRRRCRG